MAHTYIKKITTHVDSKGDVIRCLRHEFVHIDEGECIMATFFVKGLARLGELIFGDGAENRTDRWVGYREKKQLAQEIYELQEKAFSQKFI